MSITFDTDRARARLADLDPEDLPHIWMESPARAIDDMFCDLTDFITTPEHHMLLVYPLIHTDDADGVIVAVARPYPAPMLAISMDWDDLVAGPRVEYFDKQLTVDQVIDIVSEVVRYGDDLLTREASL